MKPQRLVPDESRPSFIPEPVKVTLDSGNFIFNEDTIIQANSELENVYNYLKRSIFPSTGFNVHLNMNNTKKLLENVITLQLDDEAEMLGNEGYTLDIAKENVLISAPTPAGVFYGIQSLRQLLPVKIEKHSNVKNIEWLIPCVKIVDYPRFSWRGFMLDEGRHFLGKEIVKRMLDLIAMHKMNIFHWHLTEDQGWRIEIQKYPRLVEIGSKRKGTQVGGIRSFLTRKTENKPHSGYYTQKDIKEIISYAQERYITVIPEIDMPGHSMAALAAYPEYSCTGGPFEVQTTFGIKKEIFCSGKESVFHFLRGVLDELIELFPSKIIHIGGDEVPKSRWKECPDCQTRITTEKLNSEEDLQTYFINRIASYLTDKGRIPIGWNDILDENLISEAIGQHWLHDDDKVLDHLRKGRKFVISRFFYTYLDYPYTMTPLRKVYSFDPIPKELEEEYHHNVLGIEAPLWTEWVPTIERLDWQVFPRLTAHAETGWTLQENKDYNSFKDRLQVFLKRLDILGVKYTKLEKTDPGFFKRVLSPFGMFRDPQKNITR